MKRNALWIGLAFLALLGMAHEGLAQRGAGDAAGLAQQAALVDVSQVAGTLEAVEIGPCPATLGKGVNGMHLKLTTAEGQTLKIHLGPAQQLQDLSSVLVVGQPVSVAAFQTAKVAGDQYIAQSVTVAGNTYDLRNSTLRPEWAGGRGRGAGMGRGQGMGGGGNGGNGRGWGACRLQSGTTPENLSDTAPQGWGRGQGRGRGFQGGTDGTAQGNDGSRPQDGSGGGPGPGQGGGQGGGKGRGRGPRS